MNYEFINQSHELSWKNYKQFVNQITARVETVLKLDKHYDFSIILVEPETIRSINSELLVYHLNKDGSIAGDK